MDTRVATATLLFTDLVGSTEILQRLGDDLNDEVRRAHFASLRSISGRHGGKVVKNLGDGLMVVFDSAVDAIGCAIDMQLDVQRTSLESALPLSVRIGLHVGEMLHEDDDYFGTPVVIAKRLCDSAIGGQIMISDALCNLVGTRGSYEFRDLGVVTLKGLAKSVAVHEVVWPGTPELQGDKPHRQPQPGRRRESLQSRSTLWALALVVAMIAVAGSIWALGRRDREGPSSNGRPKTPEAVRNLAWRRVSAPVITGQGQQRMHRLIATRSGLVAVGGSGVTASPIPAAWTSSDGVEWKPARFIATDDPVPQQLLGVTARNGRLVAGGSAGYPKDRDAVIWRTSGNRPWRQIPIDSAVFGGVGNQGITHLVTAEAGFVAVGYDSSGGDYDAAAWSSPDGRSWTRADAGDDVFGGEGRQVIQGVARIGSHLVAVGTDDSEGDEDAAIWRYDGFNWMRLQHDEVVFGGEDDQVMTSVTVVDDRVIAVGWDASGGSHDGAVWISDDQTNWRRVTDIDVFGGPIRQEMWGVAPGGVGLVAVGREYYRGLDAAAWSSKNGVVWTREPHDESVFGGDDEQRMRAIVAFGDRLIAVGADGHDGAVWIARPIRP